MTAADFGAYARPRRLVGASRTLECVAYVAALICNWIAAYQYPSVFFSYTSLALYGWLVLLLIRIHPRAAVMALPFIITRTAVVVSLLFIEAGSQMPEVSRTGAPGDASASFVAFTSLFFVSFTLVFWLLEKAVLDHARSGWLDRINALLRWPIIAVCIALGALAFLHGVKTGFPLMQHVDRFMYRRFYADSLVLTLLDTKTAFATLLGVIAFSRTGGWLTRAAGGATFAGLTVLFVLFGDKFFTILTSIAYFFLPYLLRQDRRLFGTVLKFLPLGVGLVAAAFALTLYIYADYGSGSVSAAMIKLGDRVAGEGELWYVATQDNRALLAENTRLEAGYAASLIDPAPPTSAFHNGVETYYFIYKYAPPKLLVAFERNQGWVQLTMGFEAMGLVMFGYVGLAGLMLAGGVLAAGSALYLRRALSSEFPLSVGMAIWLQLQVYLTLEQGSLWAVLAQGQINRFLLFIVFELGVYVFNRGEARVRRVPRREAKALALPGPRNEHAYPAP